MKWTYYKIVIDETGADRPGGHKSKFNQVVEQFKTVEDLKQFIVSRYGRMPSMKRKVYCDVQPGVSEVIGFLYSFWNKDWSHNSKSWFQTDWIQVSLINEENISL